MNEVIGNKYKIIKTLGKGFSGEVYAVDDGEGIKALKLLNRIQLNVTKGEALDNFKSEFSILSELNHPGIARILDFGFDDLCNKYYFTSELIDGRDFFSATVGRPLEETEELAVQVLRALCYLHIRGIFHFDIKPQNILVSAVPLVAKIIDFGLAGISSAPAGKAGGTPAYMAPEAVMKGNPDGRADLYSFGVVLYKALAGKNPFVSNSMHETLERQKTMVLPPVCEGNPVLPKYWDRIMARLLEKNPSDRYPNGSAVIRDINFLAGKNHEIETIDTRLSYIPEKGKLIGRADEIKKFKRMFDAVFNEDGASLARLLIVCGKQGTGKSRLISEFKYHSQLSNVPVCRWRGFLDAKTAPPFCLMMGGDEGATADEVNRVLWQYAHEKILVVWAVAEAPPGFRRCEKILLTNFTEGELKDYLAMVTGLEDPPQKLVGEILKRTDGNPLFVTELLKTMLGSGLLLDSAGRWASSTFEDMGVNFDKVQIPKTISGLFLGKYIRLGAKEQAILDWLAIFNRPLTLDALGDLAGISRPQAGLLFLAGENLVERVDAKQGWFFANVLLQGVIHDALLPEKKTAMHDKAARYLDGKEGFVKECLFHKGYGRDSKKAVEALKNLADKCLTEENFERAVSMMEEAWERSAGFDGKSRMAVEKQLGECLVAARRYREAIPHYLHLREIFEKEAEKSDPEEGIRIYEKLGDLYARLDDYDKALKLLDTAKHRLEQVSKSVVHGIIIENYIANIHMKSGRIDKAEEIFRKTRMEWEERLSDEDKKRAANNWLADVLVLGKKYDEAAAQIEKDMKFFSHIGNHYLMARSRYVEGDLFFRLMLNAMGEQKKAYRKKAIGAFEESLKISRGIGAHDLMLRAYNGTGNVYYHCDAFSESADNYERALALARKLEDLQTASAISLNLGNIFKRSGKYRDAYAWLVYAINTLENIPNKNSHSWLYLLKCKIELAETLRELGEAAKGHEVLNDAEDIIHSRNDLAGHEFWVWFERAKIHDRQNRRKECMEALKKAEELAVEELEMEELRKFQGIVKKLDKSGEKPATFKIAWGLKKMKEENNKPVSELETILEINKFLNSEHDPEHLLKMVLNFALELSGAESGLVLLVDDNGALEIKAVANAAVGPDLKRISTSMARKALESGEVVVSADALSDERFDASRSVVLNELKSVLCVPLKSRNKAIGVLYLDNRYKMNAFEKVDMRMLYAYCDQVGIALENARLISGYREMQKQLEGKLEQTTGELNEAREMLKNETSVYMTRYSYDQIIARSAPMREVFKVLDKITETNLSVYLQGSSGTGKELIARAIHFNNPQRAGKRFVAINCGAIPANLIESELFGYKAGSFTGAVRDKKGLFEEAHGGTLFLDEMAELELSLQVKLLRALQEGEVMRVGDVKPVKVDVRIVCASHRILEELVRQGKFREDLFYRLCQIRISLPPLSSRPEDIPLLAAHFVEKFRAENKVKEKIGISPNLMRLFFQHAWPGNVRELENVINVACALRNGSFLDVSSLPPNCGLTQNAGSVRVSPTEKNSFSIDDKNLFDAGKTWEDYETLIVAKCFEASGFKKGTTADWLGISASTLYKKIKGNDLENRENPIFADPFMYEKGRTLKNYIPKIFRAALDHAGGHPYAAIRQLNISQGYFYKIMKKEKEGEV